MGRNKAIGILAAVTVGLAVMSEVMTSAIEPAASTLGLTPLFAGVFLLALVSNVPQLVNAVQFARKDQMDLSIGVTVGASTQVALLVAPVLVFFGFIMRQHMNLVFSQFELVAIVLAVLVTRLLIADGKSNWLEGLMLVAVYLMLGFGFFYAPG
jgi:Ca2+:H+ antiporter